MSWWNREVDVVLSGSRLAVPLSRQSATVRLGRRTLRKSPSPPQGRHPTTPALREAAAGGGWLGRRPVPVPQGQAVTAGKGPSCHTKAASRRFLPQTYRRPGPIFSLESRPVSFSAEKEMDLAPAAGSRTPGGTPPPWRGPPAPGPEGFWKILLPLVLPAQEEVRRNLIKVCDGHDHRSGRVPL